MNKILKLILVFFFISGIVFISPAHALVSVGQQTFEQAISSDQYNKESFDFQTTAGLISSANMIINGCGKQNCPDNLKSGAINFTSQMIAGLYINPPVSGLAYVHDTINNFGIGKSVYAQDTGVGFAALRPVLEIWKIFRNIAYSLAVVALIAMGFAIMFRYKIGPQAVITIQAVLPRLIVALLLITFSYAIAGFLVDLIYVLIALFLAVMQPLGINSSAAQQQFTNANFGTLISVFLAPSGGLGAAGRVASELFPAGLGGIAIEAGIGATVGGILGSIVPGIGTIVGVIAGGVLSGALSAGAGVGIGGLLVGLILSVLLLFALFRLFFLLLTSYIQIILAVIFAPLQILLDVIPGQNGFGGWFRNLLANILVFPLTVVFLILGISLAAEVIKSKTAWSPPLLGIGSVEGAAALISYGLLLITPQIISQLKTLIAGKPVLNIGGAVSEATSPLKSAVGRIIKK